MSNTKRKECPYCNYTKDTLEWKLTSEWVCYDCRISLLDSEFEELLNAIRPS